MSKRSGQVTLTIFAAATAAGLAGCGGEQAPPPGVPYASVEQCITAGNNADLCNLAYKKAEEEHLAKAPRFQDKESCEKGVDVTQCVPTQVRNADGSFSNVFLPAMAGYMLGRMTAPQAEQPRDRGYSGGYVPYGGGYASGPIYGSRDYPNRYNDVRTVPTSRQSTVPTTQSPSRPSPSWSAPAPSRQPSITLPSRPSNVGTTTISRGGFGGSGGFSSS